MFYALLFTKFNHIVSKV